MTESGSDTNPIEFDGVIESARGGGACIPVPFDPKEAFGTRRSVRVRATYDDFEASSNVLSMDGRPILGIHKATCEAIGKGPGDRVRVSLVVDTSPRVVTIPAELDAQFTAHPKARSIFDSLSFTHRREYAEWVAGAKKQETRDLRALKAIDMLADGKTL